MYPMKERSTFVALNYFFLNKNSKFYSSKMQVEIPWSVCLVELSCSWSSWIPWYWKQRQWWREMTLKMKWEHLYLNWFLSLHTNQAVSSVTQSEISDCTELNRSLSDMIWEMSPVRDVRKFYGISLNNYTNCPFKCIKQLKNSTNIAFNKITKKRVKAQSLTAPLLSPPLIPPLFLFLIDKWYRPPHICNTPIHWKPWTMQLKGIFWLYKTTNSQQGEL